MSDRNDDIRRHYQAAIGDSDALLAKIGRMIDGLGEGAVTAERLSGLDQFHFGGLAATATLAKRAGVAPGMRVLDAGSGLGGPSRYLAETYGCDVTGVDLAPVYVAIADLLAQRAGLAAKVRYLVGDLADTPFPDASFAMVWTQHVVMNIRDRDGVYREFRRVLRPGGTLAFYDVVAVAGAATPHYPVPWAATPEASALLDESETRAALDAAGFAVTQWEDVTDEAFAWMAQQRQAAPLAVDGGAVVGQRMVEMVGNFVRNLKEGRTRLVMGIAARR